MTLGVIRSLLTQAREHLERIGIDVDSWPGDAEFAEQALAALDAALESLAARDTQIAKHVDQIQRIADDKSNVSGNAFYAIAAERDFILALLESGDAPHE